MKKFIAEVLDANITKIYLIWYLVINFILFLSYLYLPHGHMFHGTYLESLANWDGDHFIEAAKNGYEVKNRLVFFPLYPLLIKILSLLTTSYLISGILINFLAGLLLVNILYKLVIVEFNKKIAKKSILALLFFPTSFFLITIYSESVFLLMVVSAFYFLKKNYIFYAFLATIFASLTRLAGLALVAVLILEVWQKGLIKKKWYVIFSISGFVGYCTYQYYLTADLFYFIMAELNWQRYLTIPGWSLLEYTRVLMTSGISFVNVYILSDLIFAIFGMGMVLRSLRLLPLKYGIYALISILFPLFTSTLLSMPRFLLPIFPIFILLGLIKNRQIEFFIQLLSIMMLSLFCALYINGFWIS